MAALKMALSELTEGRADMMLTGPYHLGILVESLGLTPVPIVVERASYASPGGVAWGSGGAALASPLP